MVLAILGIYWIAGPMTLILLPLTVAINGVMYGVGRRLFDANGLRVRYNPLGFFTYALAYGVILQPACVAGYFSEIFGMRKSWGTK
jgi:biofilm PGA synthesis N-glycosyltransferase PgaC